MTFDLRTLTKHFRQDITDDWFPDPLGYDDLLADATTRELLEQNHARNHGQYKAFDRSLFDVPKANFTLRCALETGYCDRVLYQGLGSYLAPFFDQCVPWNSFSHRLDKHSRRRYLIRRGVESWKDFTGAVRSAMTPEKYLLSTDLSNYFEHVDLAKLQSGMESLLPGIDAPPSEKSRIRSHLSFLFKCLCAWSFDGKRGLPQNRDSSSILANVYLRPVDLEMRETHETTYFRYMDDIKMVCDDVYQARRSLKAVHYCPVRSRIESAGWGDRVSFHGSLMAARPVKWAFSQIG